MTAMTHGKDGLGKKIAGFVAASALGGTVVGGALTAYDSMFGSLGAASYGELATTFAGSSALCTVFCGILASVGYWSSPERGIGLALKEMTGPLWPHM